MVDILDEMKITGTQKYILCDMEASDSIILQKINVMN